MFKLILMLVVVIAIAAGIQIANNSPAPVSLQAGKPPPTLSEIKNQAEQITKDMQSTLERQQRELEKLQQ